MSSKFTDDSLELRDFMFPKMEIYDKKNLRKLYNNLNSKKLKDIEILSYNDTDVTVNVITPGNIYMSDKIKNYINKHLTRIVLCKFKIDDLNVTIKIYYKNEEIKEFVFTLIKYIRYITSITDISLNNLEINYYLTNFKKNIGKNIILTKDQVNSGSCLITSNNQSIINIWRKEEILKVTLHEIIHAFGFSKYSDSEEMVSHYNDRYNLSNDIVTSQEAYTEIWANILNCYLISQTTKKSPYMFFMNMISLERSYSIYIAKKILYLKGPNKKDINKITHVLPYYIIRGEIYQNLSNFIDHCESKNKDYINIKNGYEIIQFLLNNQRLKEDKRSFNKSNKNNFVYKTLRMTINELSVF